MPRPRATALLASCICVMSCRADRRVAGSAGGEVVHGRVAIDEIMVDPRATSDAAGEWFEIVNLGASAVSLRGWTIASGNDAPRRIGASLSLAPGAYMVLARDASPARNGGVRAAWGYGGSPSFANSNDWLALRDARGTTVDSIGWRGAKPGASWELVDDPAHAHAQVGDAGWRWATTSFGRGDLGTPGLPNGRAPAPPVPSPRDSSPPPPPADTGAAARELVVRVLDVGQGDATYISNGGSRVIVDGGPDPVRFGRLLDSLGLNGTTIDVVVLSHEHYDHHAGLRELFRSSRHITVRYFFENQDPFTNAALERLRDSVVARSERGTLVYRDTDDPCGDGRPVCTITMRGGAKLHVMRPNPRGTAPNNRSTPLKLVGPDSASFTMWLAGDAEHEEIDWFRQAGYAGAPGMRVDVLKADHHGSCNGVSAWYLRATDPELVTFSVGARNTYGHAHEQAKRLYA
ncbi:MAG TPA: lamin tail domain-containing protein, partial [Gemmatimonadaceae bacterium]|nr:lamin tail domain-containing protein [Gemmatimonadaceae bacterium]